MDFVKCHSFGNDFIILQADRLWSDDDSLTKFRSLVRRICDRKLGLGADGCLVLGDSAVADARMRIINADGSLPTMCGNGIRCCAQYLFWKNPQKYGSNFTIETDAGIRELIISGVGNRVEWIKVSMGKPDFTPANVPVAANLPQVLEFPLDLGSHTVKITSLSTGVPHTVIFVDELDNNLLLEIGPRLERHPFFPQGTNVNLAMVQNRSNIKLLTYERGVGLALACATGATAAAAVAYRLDMVQAPVNVDVGLGTLEISFDGAGVAYVSGPGVVMVGEGKLLL